MIDKDERQKLSEQKKRAQAKYGGRLTAEETNPCLKEQELSYKCLNDNNYDNEKCDNYFENYKICKKFWLSVERDRKARGIKPEMPSLEEREKIKAEYMKKRGIIH